MFVRDVFGVEEVGRDGRDRRCPTGSRDMVSRDCPNTTSSLHRSMVESNINIHSSGHLKLDVIVENVIAAAHRLSSSSACTTTSYVT